MHFYYISFLNGNIRNCYIKQSIQLCVLIYLIFSCSGNKEVNKPEYEELPVSSLPGNSLAKTHCGGCHTFVNPEFLPKSSWKNHVLPSMGYRLGIFEDDHPPDSLFGLDFGDSILRKANIPEKPVLAKADWIKIVDYYLENAPDTILPPTRSKKIKMGLKHFTYKRTSYSHQPPHTVMVKIRSANRGVVFSDGKRNINRLTFLTSDLKKDYELSFKKAPIHYYEKSDTVYLTTVGESVFPHDLPQGELHKVFRKEPEQKYNTANLIISNLQRPVFMVYGDLNSDGFEDIVTCEFGSLTGKLVWLEKSVNNKYSKRLLRSKPGAITAIIKDVNNDGLMDILALMAQGDEGVFLYENQGNSAFKEKRLLSFPPLYGSQYIELADFNSDGFDDLIYVCGDNGDKSPILKSYHGIYIYLNDGNFSFTQIYFYQLNGAYKALPRDYDLDGDLDIAAISFFPDYYSYPEESFIYLENKGNFEFIEYSFPESINGRWMVMDAGDMDSDGDIDLALGSHVFIQPKGDTTGLSRRWAMIGPSVIVLENTIQ